MHQSTDISSLHMLDSFSLNQVHLCEILTEKCSGTKPIRNLPAILKVDVEKYAAVLALLAEAMSESPSGRLRHCIMPTGESQS